jgi:hypothetical protein
MESSPDEQIPESLDHHLTAMEFQLHRPLEPISPPGSLSARRFGLGSAWPSFQKPVFGVDFVSSRDCYFFATNASMVTLVALSNPRFFSNAELAAAAENQPPLERGANGEGVAILQQALLDLGFAMPVSTRARGGLPDGIYGAETEAAVRAFQHQNQLLADGVAGRITLQQLETSTRLLSEAQEARFKIDYLAASRSGSLFA